jgi:hypothetical protein
MRCLKNCFRPAKNTNCNQEDQAKPSEVKVGRKLPVYPQERCDDHPE